MFRRSRFSARPNVGATGRTTQEAPSASQEAGEAPKDVATGSAGAEAEGQSVGTPSERPEAPGDGHEQHGESAGTPAALQRRKRFSVKPKVAPGRPSAVARTQKPPVKAVSESPAEAPVSGPDKPAVSGQTAAAVAPRGPQSPRRRRSSEESRQPKTQPKQTAVSSGRSEPLAESPGKNPPADGGKGSHSTSDGQVGGVPSKVPDAVPFTILDREALELSERAKSLVSSTRGRCLSPSALSLSRLLNDPSDIQRIAKAQKLRHLLKQEMHKEKKRKKGNVRVKEYNLDPAKMTMSDLIRYLPGSNPMTSSIEESTPGNETVVPPSPERDASPERSQKLQVIPKIGTPRPVEEELAEEEEDEDEDDSVMVPQVKVAEDGTLIIDEESLTVEVQRAKGPNPANDRDPIFERGSTTTYASFRKGTYTKPWSSEETDMFFLAVSMVGTDFSMICQLFPLRARSEIKNKFKKEERENSWRVDKAFRERRKLDIEYFSKLLEKILEVQENRKKLRSLAGKKSPKKTTRKTTGKKAARKLSVVEEEDEEEQNEMADLEEEEGEKENEDLVNEGGADVAKPKKKRKRKSKEALTEEPTDKKNKKGEKKSKEQDEDGTPGDTEAALPEHCPSSDKSKETEAVSEAKEAKIKPAKLSRGRAPKPLLPLGRKWGKKPPNPPTKSSDAAADKGKESVKDEGAEDQVNKDASPRSPADENSTDDNSEEKGAAVQPPKLTRYGRLPKPITPLNYPAKEAAPEATPAPPEGSTAACSKRTAKRRKPPKLKSSRESKKPKLVTIVASQSDYSDEEEEEEKQREEEEEEEVPPAGAPFVPASLRSLQPVVSQVEETLEELDIFANITDVLGISQDALCPGVSWERAQHEADTKPSDHQLDRFVDDTDLFSMDHTEVSEDDSYNEAAQTLLTIGNLAHLPQSAQHQTKKDHVTGATLANVKESIPHLKQAIASKPALLEENSVAPLMSAASDCEMIETSDNVTILHSGRENEDIPVAECGDQRADSDAGPDPRSFRKTKKGGSSEGKPKPNLGQASRTPLLSDQSASDNQSPDKALVSHVGTIGSVTPESQTGRGSNADFAKVQEGAEHPAPCVTAVVGQKEESAVGSTPPTRKSRFQKVKPKLNLARTSRTKSQTTKDTAERDSDPSPKSPEKTIAAVKVEPTCATAPDAATLDFTATEEQSGTEDKKTEVEAVGRVESGAETTNQMAPEKQELAGAPPEPAREQAAKDAERFGENPAAAKRSRTAPRTASDSEPAVAESQAARVEELPGAHRAEEEEEEGCAAAARQAVRRRFQKAKPNVPHASRTGRSRPESAEDPVPPARLGGTPPARTSGPGSADTAAASEEPRPTPGSAHLEKESPIKSDASVTEPRSPPKTTEETSSAEEQKTGAGRGLGSAPSVPQRRQRFTKVKPNIGSSPRSARAKRQPDDISKPPERCHADPPSEAAPPSAARSTADPIESGEQPLAGNDCEAQSHEETLPAAPKTEPSDSRKAPQTLRGRLIRPKPSLVRSGRPARPRQVPETKAAEREFDAAVCHRVSEVRPDAPQPAEGAVVQCGGHGSPSQKDSGPTLCSRTPVTEQPGQSAPPTDGPSLGCLTRAPDSCSQDTTSTSITVEIQTQTNVSIFPDLLLKDEQKDADEPFFILSLTEIPVTGPEPLPYHPVVPEQDGPQPSSLLIGVPGERSRGAAEGPEQSPTQPGSVVENPADCTTVQPSKLAEGNNDGSPPTKPGGPRATRRRVKERVEPRTSKSRQAGKTLAADEAEPEALGDVAREGSGDGVDEGKETLEGGDDPGGSGSGAQTARRKEGRNRNPKSFPSVTSETTIAAPPPAAVPAKAASKGPKARSAGAAAKRSAPPAPSTSGGAARPAEEARSTATTSPTERREGGRARSDRSPPEVVASRHSDSAEEEPTSVSQYFLCDIFTDVEEG